MSYIFLLHFFVAVIQKIKCVRSLDTVLFLWLITDHLISSFFTVLHCLADPTMNFHCGLPLALNVLNLFVQTTTSQGHRRSDPLECLNCEYEIAPSHGHFFFILLNRLDSF